MRLFVFPVAPNPTKVCVYLAEKGLAVERVFVDLRRGEQLSPEHRARHPLGKLPVLELDDGSFLTESLAIIELFEELNPEPPMIGTEPLERARVRSLERLADLGVLLPVGRIVHATRSPLGWPPVPEVAAEERRRLPAALEIIDGELGRHAFVAGPRPTIADCTLWAALGFASFGEVEIPPFPNLERWREEFGARPSVRELWGEADDARQVD